VRTIHLGPPPVPTIPPDDRPATLPELDDSPFILALGTVERRKNIPTLVAAFGRLAREHPTVRLVVAGSPGNDATAVERAINRLDPDAAARVLRLGPVTDVEKTWLLASARALAYPSLDEGFGFPILEAHQLGTPVVASTGALVLRVTWVPVAKMSRAISGRALSWNRAVVNEPSSRKPVAKVPSSEPRISGTSMSPPGMRFIIW
jgi:glycosyltransferase involved in cell wall biosynthesis